MKDNLLVWPRYFLTVCFFVTNDTVRNQKQLGFFCLLNFGQKNKKTKIQLDFLFSVLTDDTNLPLSVLFSLVGGASTPSCFWLARVCAILSKIKVCLNTVYLYVNQLLLPLLPPVSTVNTVNILFSYKLPLYTHAYMLTLHFTIFWHFLLDAELHFVGYWHAKSS